VFRVVVAVSGGGTNLQALIDAQKNGRLQQAAIVGVISNNRNAYALQRAAAASIDSLVVSPKDYADREAFHVALHEAFDSLKPDLIVLAGFLVRIPPAISQAYTGRMINIHPSLIPSFCGVGMYGLKVHEAALRRGVCYTGATVHFVTDGMDEGPILSQKPVRVLPDDTAKILQQRVMEEAEWVLLPKAVEDLATGKVVWEDGNVVWK
jgi:phosphoribosylglycinamide formyltransferase-1